MTMYIYYASWHGIYWYIYISRPRSWSSGDAYSYTQLSPYFEHWVEFFVCRHVYIWGFRKHVCPSEKKSPWLRQYQSYSSNWYINGKVYTSTTTWKPRFFFFQKRSKLNFDLCWKAEITLASSISVLQQ